MISTKKGLLALSPVAVLLVVYIASSLLAGDFYAVPIGVAFVVAAVYAVCILRGKGLKERIDTVSAGAANKDILYMIWIFILAGIFAATAKSVGAVDATVQLTLRAVPSAFLPAGIFLAACFISMSIGTSVGTIVALTPVVTGLAEQTGSEVAWMVAIVVGGAFFGDNLSFISDTTIASTQSQGCLMKDKFRTNFLIVLPAAIATLAIYVFGHVPSGDVAMAASVPWFKAIPYVLVIVLALCGMNVLCVLLCGIAITWVLGLATGSTVLLLLNAAGAGLAGMYELIIVTLLAGGLMSVVKSCGGFEFLIDRLTRHISGRRGAEGVIAVLTAITNVCTANNTIAIITVGEIAKDVSSRYGVAPRRAASVLDISSCIIQGMLPYGAQLLMAAGLASLSPIQIIGHLYYPMLIALMLVLSIVFQFPRVKTTNIQ